MSKDSDGPPKTPPKKPPKTSSVTPPTLRATHLIAQKDLMRTSSWSWQNLFQTLHTAMSTPSSRLTEGLAYSTLGCQPFQWLPQWDCLPQEGRCSGNLHQ